MDIGYLTGVCRLAAGTAASLASLNRRLGPQMISIGLYGSPRSEGLCTVTLTNEESLQDTANVSVVLEIRNRRTGEILRSPRNTTAQWTLAAEVGTVWSFTVGPQEYGNQRVDVVVTVTGRLDDEGLYRYQQRSGFILLRRLVLLR
jgi:hypothetical protein